MSASMEDRVQEGKSKSLENSLADMSLDDVGPSGDKSSEELIPLEPLYKLCMKYYKDNIGKALSITYQEKTRLLALHKQVTCGKYKPESGQEPGFLDVVGNDRVQAWQALGDMTREYAMKEFVKVLHKCSPSLKPYIIAYKVKLEEEAKQKHLEEELKHKQEEEERMREAAAAAAAGQQGISSQQQQEQQVRLALNQQTEAQFRSYAQSQFPGDLAKQDALIQQLQEQHFQQYVKQVYDLQMQQQQGGQPRMAQTSSQPSNSSSPADGVRPPQLLPNPLTAGAGSGVTTTLNEQINGGTADPATHNDILIQEASMWTQKDIMTFKNTIKKESRMENQTDCIIKVGSGETVTIRVPTHENGNCLFWEFATDHYDLAFGVYFEWTSSPDDNVQVHISDSSDEDEDEIGGDDKSDAEKGGDEVKKPRGPPIDEIIPIYRRDSHEQVYCGSHVYPGRGVYLLKFDNSYSLWRSKTLYYRVYYSR